MIFAKNNLKRKNEITPQIILSINSGNITFYKNFSYSNFFVFDAITKKPIDTQKLSINLHSKTPYTVTVQKNPGSILSYYIFQTIKKTNWRRMYQLYSANSEKLYNQYNNKYFAQYSKSKNPKIYSYKITIQFNFEKNGKNEIIKNLFLHYGNYKHSYPIGNISLNYNKTLSPNESGLQLNILSVDDFPVQPYSNGNFYYDKLEMETTKKIKIESIYLLNSNSQSYLSNIQLFLQKKNTKHLIYWNPSKIITLQKNTKIKLITNIHDSKLIDNGEYSSSKYLIINYKCNGINSQILHQITYRTKRDPYELFVEKNTNISFKSFYSEYYNKININS